MPITATWQRWRLAIGGLAAALGLTIALATPEGQALAATFLAQFRSQRLQIVTIDPNQTRQTGLFRLERLGTVRNNRPPQTTEVANVQEAASRAGFPVLQPDPANDARVRDRLREEAEEFGRSAQDSALPEAERGRQRNLARAMQPAGVVAETHRIRGDARSRAVGEQ